ncbi:MAG: twin-arginine translocase TatA/TatE family subunit [Chloroflexota bacterium]
MFGVGTGEILLILVIAMLVVGPERMVTFARQAGELLAKFRQQTDSVTSEFREALSLDPQDDAPAASAEASSAALPVTSEQPPAASAATPASASTSASQPAKPPAARFAEGEVGHAASQPLMTSSSAPAPAPADGVVALDVAEEDTVAVTLAEPEVVADSDAAGTATEEG